MTRRPWNLRVVPIQMTADFEDVLGRVVRPGDNVIDLSGSGGGVALATARLGAGRVQTFEVDAAERDATRNVVVAHHLAGVVSVLTLDRLDGVSRQMAGRVGVVVAALPDARAVDALLERAQTMLDEAGRLIVMAMPRAVSAKLRSELSKAGFDSVEAFGKGVAVFARGRVELLREGRR